MINIGLKVRHDFVQLLFVMTGLYSALCNSLK